MNAQTMTLEEIREVGIEALNEKLGPVGMAKFLQQTETGWGNYTEDREKWLGNPDLNELTEKIKAQEK